jgi:hypothetical protein
VPYALPVPVFYLFTCVYAGLGCVFPVDAEELFFPSEFNFVESSSLFTLATTDSLSFTIVEELI